jgi:hypothetical protein
VKNKLSKSPTMEERGLVQAEVGEGVHHQGVVVVADKAKNMWNASNVTNLAIIKMSALIRKVMYTMLNSMMMKKCY